MEGERIAIEVRWQAAPGRRLAAIGAHADAVVDPAFRVGRAGQTLDAHVDATGRQIDQLEREPLGEFGGVVTAQTQTQGRAAGGRGNVIDGGGFEIGVDVHGSDLRTVSP